ncbi:hypothetical protein [Dictyobacter vulcani]|uniref:hypothetical protein n=1 Tax=Dictyobacter vulcani TaxID=2607529 RepID=UPI00125050C2|nr:hypothetical protein [Dictyobacter vulcani]
MSQSIDNDDVEKLYDQLMAINRETFAKGLFEASYHALVSAFYIASSLQADKLLSLVAQRAQEQLWWFDPLCGRARIVLCLSAQARARQSLYPSGRASADPTQKSRMGPQIPQTPAPSDDSL